MLGQGIRVAVALLALSAAGAVRAEQGEEGEALPQRFAQWLEEVDPIILGAERQVFLDLTTDYQRDAFIDRFWRVRDPFPETAANEMKERYLSRVHQARALYRSLEDDRARIFLVHGPPRGRLEVRCSATRKPAEIWSYDGSEQVQFSILLIFLKPGDDRPAQIWHPSQTGSDTQIQGLRRCLNGDRLQLAAASIESAGFDWEISFQRMLAKPRPLSQEWVATFQSLTTDLPEDAETFDVDIEFGFPGRYQQRTVTQGLLRVPSAAVATGEFAGFRSYNFLLTGEVVLEDRLFENFRYKFAFPEDSLNGPVIPLAFQRYLRPGTYRLLLKLEDMNGKRYYRSERDLEVPRSDSPFVPTPPLDSVTERLFAEASAAVARGETSIRLIPPRTLLQKGLVRFDTLAVGDDIARVAFILDERPVMTKNRPPYNVEIDLGDYPRPHTLRAEALDESGGVVARDELRLNAGSRRFQVRLLEPRPSGEYSTSVLARARVDVPPERSVERVEFYLNDRLLATLYQPPWAQPIALPTLSGPTYVRAAAYLPDGAMAEDLVFIHEPQHFDEIDVQAVELYTTVLDRSGHPVPGLASEEFEVLEDSVKQEIVRFQRVEDLSIHVGILFDNSASMGPVLDFARWAALVFFRDAIRPRDRAAVITFNRVPKLAVQLTNDLRLLGGGLAGLSAEGETALYDSLMFGLYYFTGVRGQRALLLLSDGRDEGSRFSFQETLDFARRAGVTVYAIGLNSGDAVARERLGKIVDATGGRAFFLDDLARLPEIYGLIQEELRSQYLLTYQSSNVGGGDAFRVVEVKLARRELTARTISGYYP